MKAEPFSLNDINEAVEKVLLLPSLVLPLVVVDGTVLNSWVSKALLDFKLLEIELEVELGSFSLDGSIELEVDDMQGTRVIWRFVIRIKIKRREKLKI